MDKYSDVIKLNRRNFLKLILLFIASLFGYYMIKNVSRYQATDEKESPYYKIYIENGLAMALNVKKDTIDYQSLDHIVAIQNALDNLPTRTQKEKVSLLGDFIVTDTIKIPSYTILELQGSVKLANNANKLLVQEINPAGENTNIMMIGGTYDGNKQNQDPTATADHVIKFSKVIDSHFKDMIVQNAVNDNFILDTGCNNNLCENILGRLSGTGRSTTNDGNGLVDRGDHNTWKDCISEDNFSDCWVIKCRDSKFIRCIGRGSKNAVGFGLFGDRNIIGNRFETCSGYDNKTSGMSLNIPKKSDGDAILVNNNFIQGEFFDNGIDGVRFIDTTADGSLMNNIVDILVRNNREIGFYIHQQTIRDNSGTIVPYDNKEGDCDINGKNNTFSILAPKGKDKIKVYPGNNINYIENNSDSWAVKKFKEKIE